LFRGLIPEYIRNDTKIDEWEVCPQAGLLITQVCERILCDGGFGLFVDYGHDGSRKNFSLRAYKKMNQVNPLSEPGNCDITSDVNFGYLKSLIQDRALVFGPVEQR
jgi:NADH dehydrogenase [ubiquinone] 1 alpha subcomplex assembly factor 7